MSSLIFLVELQLIQTFHLRNFDTLNPWVLFFVVICSLIWSTFFNFACWCWCYQTQKMMGNLLSTDVEIRGNLQSCHFGWQDIVLKFRRMWMVWGGGKWGERVCEKEAVEVSKVGHRAGRWTNQSQDSWAARPMGRGDKLERKCSCTDWSWSSP